MKQRTKLIISISCIIAFFIIAVIGYNFLSKRYNMDPDKNNINKNDSFKSEEIKYKAPDISVTNYDGNVIKLSDYIGKPVVINFWASWCSPCKSELPDFNNAYKKYSEDVIFLMVNLTDGVQETKEKVIDFVKDNNYNFPYFFDEDNSAAEAYGIYSIPMTYFVNKDGDINSYNTGAINEKVINDSIEAILK